MRRRSLHILGLATLSMAAMPAQELGRSIYEKRCFWCHGEQGKGDGPSAAGMIPRPRDFAAAEYKIRSTGPGQLPTDEDLLDVILRGMAGTPMPGWQQVLSENERRQLVSYIKSFSLRFQSEKPEPLEVPGGSGDAARGKEIFRAARCFACHGESGRPEEGITTVLHFEWGLPPAARDFTQGWTFKGGHEPRDIYLRITGGLTGTPMGPYQELLSNQERWDVAHYVASLDRQPRETSEDFTLMAAFAKGQIPDAPNAAAWQAARPILVPLAGQIVLDAPLRWWMPTATTAVVRALWNGRGIGFLLEWNDSTGPNHAVPDSALLQFAAQPGSRPYFLFGSSQEPAKVWQWNEGDGTEEWTTTGSGASRSDAPSFQVSSQWKEGRWQVIFRGSLRKEPRFEPGQFVPILFSVCDGANGEVGNSRAISTWLYTTLEPAPSLRPWLSGLLWLLSACIAELWVLSRLQL